MIFQSKNFIKYDYSSFFFKSSANIWYWTRKPNWKSQIFEQIRIFLARFSWVNIYLNIIVSTFFEESDCNRLWAQRHEREVQVFRETIKPLSWFNQVNLFHTTIHPLSVQELTGNGLRDLSANLKELVNLDSLSLHLRM